jgi:small subunit ribosomal protein S2
MKGLPGAIFVIDPKKEYIAIREAGTLGIPVVAVCDTNCNPSGIDYVIPGNDDAIKSIALFTKSIAEAAIEGNVAGRDDALGDQIVAGGEIGDVEIYRRGVEERPVPVDPNAFDDSATEEPAVDDDDDSDADA